jgi:PPOX class probable F420-dependent enzyme
MGKIDMDIFNQFKNQKYLNLETFRKSGEGVKTPVWFAQDGNILYVQTGANSRKVKRIHNNGHVNVATCKMDGKVVGSWIPAHACVVTDPEVYLFSNRLLGRKYGILKKMFENQRVKKSSKDIILEIRMNE